MLENDLIKIDKRIHRVYILLDKPFNMNILDYKWSSAEPEWIIEKMVWNIYGETMLRNNLRDGKYLIGVF